MNPEEFEPDLRLITEVSELEGTCYFEFYPGKYQDKCWNATSVFLSEEAIITIEKIFQNAIRNYDHYAFMEMREAETTQIIKDLEILKKKLEAENSSFSDLPLSNVMQDDYAENILMPNWHKNKVTLVQTISELMKWLEERKSGLITLMGM